MTRTDAKNPDGSVERYLEKEASQGLTSYAYYADFAERVRKLKTDLNELIAGIQSADVRSN